MARTEDGKSLSFYHESDFLHTYHGRKATTNLKRNTTAAKEAGLEEEWTARRRESYRDQVMMGERNK